MCRGRHIVLSVINQTNIPVHVTKCSTVRHLIVEQAPKQVFFFLSHAYVFDLLILKHRTKDLKEKGPRAKKEREKDF